MSLLTVRHVTVYRYSEPVELGEHRMMFRPRESHDLRLLKSSLEIMPTPASLRWLHDTFDNSVAVATFDVPTMELRFDSSVTLEHFDYASPRRVRLCNIAEGAKRPELARLPGFLRCDEFVTTDHALLSNTKPAENYAQKIVGTKLPGDRIQLILREP